LGELFWASYTRRCGVSQRMGGVVIYWCGLYIIFLFFGLLKKFDFIVTIWPRLRFQIHSPFSSRFGVLGTHKEATLCLHNRVNHLNSVVGVELVLNCSKSVHVPLFLLLLFTIKREMIVTRSSFDLSIIHSRLRSVVSSHRKKKKKCCFFWGIFVWLSKDRTIETKDLSSLLTLVFPLHTKQ
jgi:hypothetical protein